MPAYYNEIDPYAAAWLRNLIAAGHIAPGDVDERSIVDVQPDDLRGYEQVHFFAGIGGWSLALRHAMWPDDRPVWTGSCPCQPFSAAGKQRGTDDERHLWPVFHRLIAECRPATVFGEQVASALGRDWLAGVRADLEALGYAVGAADLCAASVGAPHIRQRLWWVADASFGRHREHERNARAMGRKGEAGQGEEPQAGGVAQAAGHRGEDGGLADADQGQRGRVADGERRQRNRQAPGWQQGHGVVEPGGDVGGVAEPGERGRPVVGAARVHEEGSRGLDAAGRGAVGRLDDAIRSRLEGYAGYGHNSGEPGWLDPEQDGPAAATGSTHWSGAVFIPCSDGKARRTQPGIFPLAHGVPGRVGKLRAAGNAIVPQVAAEFIKAWVEA